MIIPTDIEVFGYKNVKISPEPTDIYVGEEKYCNSRVQVNTDKYLIIDLGQGRQIRIHFNSNKTDIA